LPLYRLEQRKGGYMRFPVKLSSLILTVLLCSSTYAGDGVGSSAMEFLNIGVSARSAATGGAFSAVSDGPVSAYYNPAGLSRADNFQLAGMHSEWFQDLRYEYIGLALPVGGGGGLGLSFSYLNFGDIEGYSETGVPTGNVSAYDMAATFSYGHRISSDLSIGLGIKAIGEKLDNADAFGFAGDVGLQYRFGNYLGGLSLMNIGPKIKYETSSSPLPTTINAGISYLPFGGNLGFLAGAAIPFSGDPSFKVGLEYIYQDLMVLRSGYDFQNSLDSKNGLSFGGGLNLSSHSLDYAYNINNLMGGTHQISFVFRFGQPRAMVSSVSSHKIDYENEHDFIGPVEVKIDESKQKYEICAGRYNNQEAALKHMDTLKIFGFSAKLIQDGDDEFRVVLKEVKGRGKAEKIKTKYEEKGISCFVQPS
jgi:hypothetical protein